jgi:2-methylcitrate dehydratase PrpD
MTAAEGAGRMTVIETIANWSRQRPGFNPLARERAAHAILDTVSCVVAGVADPAAAMARQAFASSEATGRGVMVGGGRGSPGQAALVNATAAHALDYDDTFRPLMGHASAVLVPALLAVAGMTGADGRRLVEAYLVGLEAQAIIGDGVNPGHYAAGWHATSTVGAIGAAAGTAWLMDLDEAGIARAMSLVVSMAAGIKGQFGTPAKPLHAGLSARNAVEAAMLAAAGMTGRLDIIEHRFGFDGLYAASGKPWNELLATIGEPHSIEAVGLSPKRHPCCASTHNTLDMVFDLKAEFGFAATDVAGVDALVGSINKNNLSYAEPVDEMQARFSMNYCVALALAKDRLRIADFTQGAVEAPAIRKLLPLTRMRAYTPQEEGSSAYLPHKIAIHLHDGRVLAAERDMEKGTASDPFSERDRRDKHTDCCDAHLDPGIAAELYDRLGEIEDQKNLDFIADAFAAAR